MMKKMKYEQEFESFKGSNLLGLVVTIFFCCFAVSCRSSAPSSDLQSKLEPCSLAPSKDSCGYYSCAEEKQKCGTDGYLLGYGKKYCEKFATKCDGKLISMAAQKWIEGTTHCLQKKAFDSRSLACGPFETQAFNDHPFCYTEGSSQSGGLSFCHLSPSDWVAIRGCVAAKDRRSTKGLKQVAAVAFKCATRFRPSFFLEGAPGSLAPDPMLEQLDEKTRRQKADALEEFAIETEEML